MYLFNQFTSLRKHFIIYIFPPLLIIANYFAFHFFITAVNLKEGYLSGMIFYWVLFCIIPVLLWINKRNLKLLFRVKRINWWQLILIVLPVLFAFVFSPFKFSMGEITPGIILLSALFAIINAVCEEYLWRGLYIDHHQANFFYAVFVPSIWFGIWYYVPLSINPAGISHFYFILSAIGMGMCWGIVTFYTRSVFWSVLSHTLVDLSGLGVLYFFN